MLSTINVIFIRDVANMGVERLASFRDHPDDNRAAEELFKKWATETFQAVGKTREFISDEDMSEMLDDGCAQFGNSGVYLVHSTETHQTNLTLN